MPGVPPIETPPGRAPPIRLLVSILAWNDVADTGECLRHLLREPSPRLRVVLLDNGSERSYAEPLRDLASRHRVDFLRSERNLGFAAGHALVLASVEPGAFTHLLLLNNDVAVDGAAIWALARAAVRERASIAGPAVTFLAEPSRVWQGGGRILGCLGHLRSRWKNADVRSLPAVPEEVDFISGCAMLIAAETLREVGFLDERYFYSVEDWDYCRRVKLAGGRIVFIPEVRVPHKVAASAGGWLSPFAVLNNLWGRAYYLRKFARRPCAWLAWPFLFGAVLPWKVASVEIAGGSRRAFLSRALRALRLGREGVALGLGPSRALAGGTARGQAPGSAALNRRVLLILTRDPAGATTGRGASLRSLLASVERLGFEPSVATLSRRPVARADSPASGRRHEQIHLPLPAPFEIARNVVTGFVLGRLSLNECLYYRRANHARLAALHLTRGFEWVYCDMIRTAEYGRRLALPWVLDLDDLLSERYAAWASRARPASLLLGYYGREVAGGPRWLLTRLAASLLPLERRVLRSREVELAACANAVCVASSADAARLGERSGTEVLCASVGIVPPPRLAAVHRRPARLVFVGDLSYQANVDAVRYYILELAPCLRDLTGRDYPLAVIGNCPPDVRGTISGESVRVMGYEPDLGAALREYQIFVAPMAVASGLKTKVIEAMANGLPVVTTPAGAQGTGAVDGEHCLVGRTPAALASGIALLVDDVERAVTIGAAGAAHVARRFSPAASAARWSAIIERATGNAVSRAHVRRGARTEPR